MDYKITVIVPVYKVRNRILNTLESLKEQTFKDFNVLFIDDGSPDDSSEVIKEHLENSEVNYEIIKKENGGVSSARNLGIDKATGHYIQFLDSDDYIDKNMLEVLYKKAICGNYDIVYSAYVFEEKDKKEISNNLNDLKEGEYNGKEACLNFIYGFSHTHIMAHLFRKSLIVDNNIKFDENRKFAEDIAFEIKAYAHAKTVYCINNIYAHYVKYEESVTNNISLNFLDIYYSNIDTLKYLEETVHDKDLEGAMKEDRIPIAIVNVITSLSKKPELKNEMYKFINNAEVRKYLKQQKVSKIKLNKIKFFILNKAILYRPSLVEKYYKNK